MWAIKLNINIKQITTVILQVISWEIILKKKRKIVCLLLNYYTIMFIFNPYLQENISSKSIDLCLTFMNYVQSQSFLGVHYS